MEVDINKNWAVILAEQENKQKQRMTKMEVTVTAAEASCVE